MKRSLANLFHAAAFAVGSTGLAWGWMAYVWEPGPEPIDPVAMLDWSDRHGAEPLVRDLHLLAAPALVFAVGLIWASHVAPRLRRPWARRATGLALALLVGPMVLSGVLLQTASSPESRTLWVWIHGVSASAWTLAWLGHALGYFRTKS